MSRVSVVIPAFNHLALTQRCVATLRATTAPEVLADVVVVDDASTDGESAAWIAAAPDVVPVLLPRNRGFAGACNAGAARCTGDAILFLNTDAFAHPGSVAALRDALERDPAVGIAGARLLYADGTLQHAGMGLLPGGNSAWWHIFKHHPAGLAGAGVARDLLAVTGAALIVRTGLFRELGGFDERFENGWEDVDLCLRAWCAGARVRYEPAAVFDHLESATLGRRDDHAANERRFSERWASVLAGAPRYPRPPVPPVALAAVGAGRDGWPLAHAEFWWSRYLGAAVTRTRAGSRIDRARVDLRAALDRRLPTLEIAWGDACLQRATGSRRVAFVAPRTASEARGYARARDVAGWWTPTPQARDALVAAGAPADQVVLAPLGARVEAPPVRSGVPVVAIARCGPATELAAQIAAAAPAARLTALTDDAPPALDDVDLVVVPPEADRWGLLVAAALGRGCAVVTVPGAAAPAGTAGLIVVSFEELGRAAAAQLAGIAELRAAASGIVGAARRSVDAVLATEKIAELARAAAGGLPPASLAEVDGRYAQFLRGATPAPAAART